jgi:hypothetical protein
MLDHDVGLGLGRLEVAAADGPLVRLVRAELLQTSGLPGCSACSGSTTTGLGA